MSYKSTDSDGRIRDEPYRMTFGKHRGLTIEELSPGYRQFLIREKAYDNHPDLKAALIAGEFLQPVQTQSAASEPISPTRKRKALEQTVPSSSQPSKTPASSVGQGNENAAEPVSPTRKRKALEQTVPSSSQPSKRPALLAGLGNEDATEHTGKSQVADLYFLDFGIHVGKRLPDVPSGYIDYLINKEVYTNRPALATALRALGRLDTPGPAALKDSRWKAPHVSEAKDPCFFDPCLDAPLWISDKDAATYFNLRVPSLESAGVHLVSKREMDAYSEFGSLFVQHGRRRWLYPVFACAHHFNTVSPGTARQALQRFLGKNKERESEIMQGLGLGL